MSGQSLLKLPQVTLTSPGGASAVTDKGEDKLERIINKTLKDLFGWKGYKSLQQLEALIAILQGELLLTVILPTGGGKSLLFMLPTAAESEGITVIIVPFVSLVTDLVRRCKSYHLGVSVWKPSQQDRERIIIVVVETVARASTNDSRSDNAVIDCFLQFASLLSHEGLLRRIFFDECHTLVTQQSFRPAMSKLFELRSLKVPMIFLSATLPPTSIAEFERVMVLSQSKVRYIRASSLRLNIRIAVYSYVNR